MSSASQAWALLRRRPLATVLVAMTLVRLAFLVRPPMPDEAGFYLVARAWTDDGPFTYGHYWVDRPPGLLALFGLAALLGHWWMVRMLAVLASAGFVVLVWWTVRRLRGSANLAAVVAACWLANPVLDGVAATGELFAVPWVMLAVLLVLESLRRPRRPAILLSWGAGVAGAVAMTVKQNFTDGLVFAVVLLLASLVRRQLSWRRAVGQLAAVSAGAATVVAVVLAFGAVSGSGVDGLVFAVVGFRAHATSVLASHSVAGPLSRASGLLLFAVVTGMVPLLVWLARRATRLRLRASQVGWAIGVTAAVELVGVVGGGSYWRHYLIQLTPMLCLAVGRHASLEPVRRLARLAIALSLLAAVVMTGWYLTRETDQGTDVGEWLAASASPGDTAVVLYGRPDTQLASGMRSPYPYLWSLPTRTLDPHLVRFRRLLAGPWAPTWLVEYDAPDRWQLDPHGRVGALLRQRYRRVATVCGRAVWLRADLRRREAAVPPCPRNAWAATLNRGRGSRWAGTARTGPQASPIG